MRVKSPSGRLEWVNRYSATTMLSTESPKNSRRSLCFVPWRASFANEVWVRAVSKRALF